MASTENDTPDVNTSPVLGESVIRAYLKNMPSAPGVYRMLDKEGNALYVGKAKNLKNRVSNYANRNGLSMRIARMVSLTASMEIVTTHTEAEALLLEANLIKKLMPRYNILLRDDKSFPFILITREHDYPRIVKHRGAQNIKGAYFGPFATTGAVNETLSILQKAFLLRPCNDFVFSSRTRPCLQYQIKRCSAPCVGYVDKDAYGKLIRQAEAFLQGKNREMQDELLTQMQTAAEAMDYETAASLRDRIKALTRVQQEGRLQCAGMGDADVIGLHRIGDRTCIQVFFFRAGQNYGNKSYFPSHAADAETEEILSAFLGQLYQTHQPPKSVLLSLPLAGQTELLQEALSLKAGYKVQLSTPQRGDKATAMAQVVSNAEQALKQHMAQRATQDDLLEGVAKLFALDKPPTRIEVYDNSHLSGKHALGAMIVAGPEGFIKNQYRQFGIQPKEGETQPITGGDDYRMMRETLTRRFSRLLKDDPDQEQEGLWPDLILVDGGAAHLTVVEEVFAELGITSVPYVCIAKGVDRNAGREWFHRSGLTPFQLPPHDPVLHYLQRLRDEAHRFAIGSHRNKRSKAIRKSELEDIPGIGALRKKALLHHFGSAKAASTASLAELESVPGINKKTAQTLYNYFHS